MKTKREESDQLKSDVEKFLKQGGKVKELPGFGQGNYKTNPKRYNFGDARIQK